MSTYLIHQYYAALERTFQFGKTRNETSIRQHFMRLLNEYAHKQNYEVIPELSVMGTKGRPVRPDGAVNNLWGLTVGLWESKDEKDDLAEEIDAKIKKGYPLTNILFEDGHTAVLYQYGEVADRVAMSDPAQLDRLLTAFFQFKSENVHKFEVAIEKFKADIPAIVTTLRHRIQEGSKNNAGFRTVEAAFHLLCKDEINPDIALEDIREMMIQHILTSDIFNKVFNDAEFHRHNTIAAALELLVGHLFTYQERRNLLMSIEHYYAAINATAAAITDHHEKQKFLKVLYENFYKVYNPKAADRLGVVYTPNEIVQFMVKSTGYLLHKHFGKTLADKGVDILDPATGTGTFICEIIEHAIPKKDLAYKFKNEIHANEVAILPYYIANLNIEFTFKQKMEYYEEFSNLCFVDTLDNTAALSYTGKQESLFALSSENAERIRRQNSKRISVVIGNPPYNANQMNENENNKNRAYPQIDQRIKDTFIKHSTAQKTKVYDMYARFFRWSMDRLDKNGILAFITNRSFIESRTFDGFRKCVQDEFAHCYIIDTRSDVRTNPKIAGTTHNVFGIQTGVAVMFLVKKEKVDGRCQIEYVAMEDEWRKEEKLNWLRNHPIEQIHFESIQPDKANNWVNLTEDNDWENLIATADKDVKLGRGKKAIFELFSLGVVTNRDEWVYDERTELLEKKVRFLINTYSYDLQKFAGTKKEEVRKQVDSSIKWTRAVLHDLARGKGYTFDAERMIDSLYRPFFKRKLYFSKELNEMQYLMPKIFGLKGIWENHTIYLSGPGSTKPLSCLATSTIAGLDFLEKTQCLPLYTYNSAGERKDNITDWGLAQFQTHYQDETITKEAIFHYTYAVLHHPAYRKKYELNLKREFPRLPFYEDFWQWAAWGQELMALHIGYEAVEPYPLTRHDQKARVESKPKAASLFEGEAPPSPSQTTVPKIKVKLKADKTLGVIEVDEVTHLAGIPKEAWDYRLGNRSALEWVLDQYKEKKPKDPTIAEKFDTYRFADYKEHVIDLLMRVCRVSVETMRVVGEMAPTNE